MRVYSPADSADYADECSKLHYFAEKDSLVMVVVVFVVFGFRLRNLRDLRETLGFLLCGLIEYACVFILPQIAQMTQRNAAGLHYIAEKDRLFEVKAVLLLVCVNQRDI